MADQSWAIVPATRARALTRRGVLAATGATLALPAIIRSARAADNQIILGSSLPLSGPAAPTGITTQRTIDHALEQINAKGIMVGGTKYTMVAQHYDNKYVPAE